MDSLASEKKKRDLTQPAFDQLLAWLDSDRDLAAEKYEAIRSALVKIFVCQGSAAAAAEDLADETINRVIFKVPDIAGSYVGNPALYFSSVAKFVLLEYKRRRVELPLVVDPPKQIPHKDDDIEQEYECLQECMDQLPPHNRELILDYYKGEKQGMIDNRKRLAARLRLTLNALRVRADRIRASLEECVNQCLAGAGRM